jgi:NAD+ synthase (glutamine-hydrolysing)
MKVALGQINVTVGDLTGNTNLILAGIDQARELGADLVVFPELCVIGYPPNDLLFKQDFIRGAEDCLQRIAAASTDIAVIVGGVQRLEGARKAANTYDISMVAHQLGFLLANSAFLMAGGKVQAVQAKTFLPNYDVFDETRYFEPARERSTFELKGQRFGVNVCEDIWVDAGPVDEQFRQGAEFVINISASPFYKGKWKVRKDLVRKRAMDNHRPVLYVNSVGGQDSLIFDGGSFGFDGNGNLIALAKHFVPDVALVNTENPMTVQEKEPSEVEEVHQALILGLRDYVNKNGFDSVVLGLSGGIDSALVAALAAAALRPERVKAVSMPGPYSSKGSITDAEQLCANLYMELKSVPIGPAYKSYLGMLKPEFHGRGEDVAEQNIQARIRGNILMALSNKFGWLVLSTGNKSEVSVGYNTLYGDLAGGLSVISDVPKTLVYKLCHYINDQVGRPIIPRSVMTKPPSAELKANQVDQDDLPPYEILDDILHRYIEENQSREQIVEAGFDAALVKRIIQRVDRNEYKRQQAPLGLKITPKAFGFGRRMPITNKYT